MERLISWDGFSFGMRWVSYGDTHLELIFLRDQLIIFGYVSD